MALSILSFLSIFWRGGFKYNEEKELLEREQLKEEIEMKNQDLEKLRREVERLDRLSKEHKKEIEVKNRDCQKLQREVESLDRAIEQQKKELHMKDQDFQKLRREFELQQLKQQKLWEEKNHQWDEQVRYMRKELEAAREMAEKAQEDAHTLRQQNFKLNKTNAADLGADFPTGWELLTEYTNFRKQRLVDFVIDWASNGELVEEVSLAEFCKDLVQLSEDLVREKRNAFRDNILHGLKVHQSPTRKVVVFLEEHMQLHYSLIFTDKLLEDMAIKVSKELEDRFPLVGSTSGLESLVREFLSLLSKMSVAAPPVHHCPLPQANVPFDPELHMDLFGESPVEGDIVLAFALPAVECEGQVRIPASVIKRQTCQPSKEPDALTEREHGCSSKNPSPSILTSTSTGGHGTSECPSQSSAPGSLPPSRTDSNSLQPDS
jgi:hypothetical protein